MTTATCRASPDLDRRRADGRRAAGRGRARFGCKAICGYGMTETSPTARPRSLDKPGERPVGGAAGHHRAARSWASTSGCSTTAASRCPGTASPPARICVRSNHVMAGYWERPRRRRAALAGGWLRTGDIAVVDARRLPHDRRPHEGPHHLRRREHLVRRGGEGAGRAPGRPRGGGGRRARRAMGRGAAGVRWCSAAATPATADELVAFARERLAHFKAPKRRALRRRAAQGRHRQGPQATSCGERALPGLRMPAGRGPA